MIGFARDVLALMGALAFGLLAAVATERFGGSDWLGMRVWLSVSALLVIWVI